MEIAMSASGLMRKLWVKENTLNPLVMSMTVNFIKMNNMELALSTLLMVACIGANSTEEKDRVKGNLRGRMDHFMKAIFFIIKFLGLVNINGWMAELLMVSGKMV